MQLAVRLCTAVVTLSICFIALAQVDPNKTYLLLSGQVILMKRTAPKGEDFHYRVLGTTKIDTMEKELNEAAATGYCFLPGTMLTRTRTFGPAELVAFLERAPGSSPMCEYRVLGTSRTGTMEDEVLAAEEKGFAVADMAQAGELAVVLERRQ
jgi:hypothetical protein